MTSKIKRPEIKNCCYCQLHNSPYCRECYDFDKFLPLPKPQMLLEDFAE